MMIKLAKNPLVYALALIICSAFIALPMQTQADEASTDIEAFMFNSQSAVSDIDPNVFRDTYIRYLIWASQAPGVDNQVIVDTIQKIQSLDAEQMNAWIRLTPDPARYIQLLEEQINASPLSKPTAAAPPQSSAVKALATSTALYPPDYGSNVDGSNYQDVYLDFLANHNFISSPFANDERCSNEAYAKHTKTLTITRLSNAAADAACTVAGCDPTGIGCAIVCVVGEIVDATTEVMELITASCDGHNGTVDSAEIEAAYENTKIIAGQNDILIDAVTALQSSVTALQNSVNVNSAKLDTLQVSVNGNTDSLNTVLQRQLEEVRLLTTPQGLRATDVPACDGGPCTWAP